MKTAILLVALVLCASAAGASFVAQAQQKPARRPNIIFIMGDDQAPYAMGAYGNKLARTPNLDRLAAGGVRFDHAYPSSPVCTPSRQSIITGKLPQASGVGLLATALPDDQLTIAEHLKAYGYRTGAIGKMHFNSPLKHGFDYRVDRPEYQQYIKEHPLRPVPAGVRVKGAYRPFKDAARIWLNADYLPEGRYDADTLGTFLAKNAVEYVKQKDEKPFCLWVSFYEPHSPFDFPLEYAGMYDPARMPVPPVSAEDERQVPLVFRDLSREQKQRIVASYYTSTAFHDKNVGLVLDAVKQQGLENNTLIVYVGDHGYNLGHHGRFEKHVFYESAVRAPLIVSYPPFNGRGRVAQGLVEFIDLMPTILDVCGVEHPSGLQGRSFINLLNGKTTKHREYVFSEYLFNWEEAMIRTNEWKFVYTKGNRERDDGYETAYPKPGKLRRLYNVLKDPEEKTNLFDRPEHRKIVRDLEHKLYERLVTAQPDTFRAPPNLTEEQVIDLLLVAPEQNLSKSN